MHKAGRRFALIIGLMLLFSLVYVAAAQTAEGCVYKDLNGNAARDTNEPCESGWTLHAVVKDNTGAVVQQGDFVTNQLGSVQSGTPASNKFSYTLPTYTSGTWTANISMSAPPGYVVVAPTGGSTSKPYTSGTTTVSGFAFGYKPIVYTAEGCYWVDADGDGARGASETCQAGQTLHALVTDGTNTIIEQDFTTNTAGSDGKFSYTLPAIPAGVTYYVTISEVPPSGYVVISPSGIGNPPTYSTTKSYISTITIAVGGYTFGNRQVAAAAEGCYWIDADGDGQQGASETCQAGQTLHAVVKDDSGTVVTGYNGDFTTNALGSGGKFSYSLPVPPTGKTWTITISEVAPNGYVNIVPVGGSTTKSYSALAPTVGGFSFGNQPMAATAEGCYWIDADGDGARGASETCQAGQTLHAVVKDDSGTIVTGSDVDFTTNTLGTDGKFSYSLPVPPTGKTWTITISEVAPNGYVIIVPVGGSITKPVLGARSDGRRFRVREPAGGPHRRRMLLD